MSPVQHSLTLRVALVAWLSLIVAVGCGDSEEAGPADIGIDDGASAGASESGTATEVDGLTLALSTGAELEIPKNAVEDDVEITIERPDDARAMQLLSTLPTSQKFVSAPYILTPHGTEFVSPATLRMPIVESADRDNLAIARLDDEDDTTWSLIGEPVVSGRTATIEITSFSILCVVETEDDVPGMMNDRDSGGQDSTDGGSDAGSDGGSDAGSDGGSDAGSDGGSDAGSDGGSDAGSDGGSDAGSDAGTDSGMDSGTDSGVDAGMDADVDAAIPDGGIPLADGGVAICGDGIVDYDVEGCDIAILEGDEGYCPQSVADCDAQRDDCAPNDGGVNPGEIVIDTEFPASGACRFYCDCEKYYVQ